MIYILALNHSRAMDYARNHHLGSREFLYAGNVQLLRARSWDAQRDQIVELDGFRERPDADDILACVGFMTFGASAVTWYRGEDSSIVVDLHDPEELERWLKE